MTWLAIKWWLRHSQLRFWEGTLFGLILGLALKGPPVPQFVSNLVSIACCITFIWLTRRVGKRMWAALAVDCIEWGLRALHRDASDVSWRPKRRLLH